MSSSDINNIPSGDEEKREETNAVDDEKKSTTETAFNPSEENNYELERLKGDAIGTTLYSERFVLNTLLKLSKLESPMKLDEELERNLCALWDMTIETDVVNVLVENNVLELFAQCIDATEDQRLTEILVGIIGNMCSVPNACAQLYNNTEVMTTVLGLIVCTDTLTLIQLMRLLSAMLLHVEGDAVKTVFNYFSSLPSLIQDLSFLLSNSTNDTLLAQALDALNAILAKFALMPPQRTILTDGGEVMLSFTDVFVKECVVESTVEAFRTLMPKRDEKSTEIALPTASNRKTMQIFLNIHCILTQYSVNEIDSCYGGYKLAVIDCLESILEPLCEVTYLLPLSSYDLDVVENINDIFLTFDDPFHEECMNKIITIWALIAKEDENRSRRSPPANEFEANESDDDEVNYSEFSMILLDLIKRTSFHATHEQLRKVLRMHEKDGVILQLFDGLHAIDTDNCDGNELSKLKLAYESLSDTEEAEEEVRS